MGPVAIVFFAISGDILWTCASIGYNALCLCLVWYSKREERHVRTTIAFIMLFEVFKLEHGEDGFRRISEKHEKEALKKLTDRDKEIWEDPGFLS